MDAFFQKERKLPGTGASFFVAKGQASDNNWCSGRTFLPGSPAGQNKTALQNFIIYSDPLN